MEFGLTLANRGVMFGVTTPAQMIQMAEIADTSGVFRSVWSGDALLSKPRLESVTLLSAVAARTRRVRLGTACMASFPVRDPVLLAYQWASLDQISEGRSTLVVCTGLGPLEAHRAEARHYGMEGKDRVGRMLEGITILKRLWTEDNVSFAGRYHNLDGVTIGPKPARQPHPPIWIANSVWDPVLVEKALKRVVSHADGLQSSRLYPAEYADRWKQLGDLAVAGGRSPAEFDGNLYHNININEDREHAYEESKRFLEMYYGTEFTPEVMDRWVTIGSPAECIEKLRRYAAAGVQEITLRMTAWDQVGQLKRCIEEVLPQV
jgi:alkanesulfonate monooxygenase SsuD/methylene tetrahydromethanopterin reductase-like flavin-dependent oxidoreductase (luciferase family)